MILDPKKNYPPVRVRLVDYKTKAMIDLSLPSEYFSEDELTQIKASFMDYVNKGDVVAATINDSGCDQSDENIESAVFSEEEKDGEE